MIIFKDYVFGFELLSDAFPLKLQDDGSDCYCFTAKMISSKSGDIDPSLIGGNASAEEPAEESTEATVTKGFDFEFQHQLEKHEMDKKNVCSLVQTVCEEGYEKS